MSYPSIHDAFSAPLEPLPPSKSELKVPPPPKTDSNSMAQLADDGKYPADASYSNYPIKIRCPKCRVVSITRMSNEMGAAAWVWCVLLAPFGCVGISCLCIDSCRDKIHFCNRCGSVVGKKFAKVC